MKMLKKILLTFLAAIITVGLTYGSFKIYAAGNKDKIINFRNASDFDDAFSGYHGEMNKFFNAKIKKMVALVDKKKLFLPPEELKDSDDIPTIVQKCGDDNISTYCVSMAALGKYSEYIKKLNQLKGNIKPEKLGDSSIEEIIAIKNSEARSINKESQNAKSVMEATVNAYNEFRLAYPMHIKYGEILKQLTKYKLILKDIRLKAAEFPVRFVDVSTSQCQ
ncbi:hypothetical protein HZA40_04410 [Candidatus Peregrinibacteria bacterium]|nr:hypothetical protein [Candidatus Peregrinibacteria bacterium]